jgi:hypothetical protein
MNLHKTETEESVKPQPSQGFLLEAKKLGFRPA